MGKTKCAEIAKMFYLCFTQIDMATVKLVLRTYKQNKEGKFALAIRITVDRKSTYKFIEWIHKKEWDESNKRVKSSHPNSKRLNNLILQKLAEANDSMIQAEATNQSYTASHIKTTIDNKKNRGTFFDLADTYIEELRSQGKFTQVASEKGRLNNIKSFLNQRDIFFHEMDEQFLIKLRIYLHSEKEVSQRTIVNHYVFIRGLFNRAIRAKLVDRDLYPFGRGKIVIKFPETTKVGLDPDEIKLIENVELEKFSKEWHARNVFLFSFYLAGIRISDTLKMKWSQINDGRLTYQMGKNKKTGSLLLPEKALNILEQYKESARDQNDFLFPDLRKADLSDPKDIHAKIRTATKRLNNYLAKVAKELGITKKISTHIARHSFGNVAGDKISPHMLQKLYRHSSINTTIGYQQNFIHKDADDALGSVLDF